MRVVPGEEDRLTGLGRLLRAHLRGPYPGPAPKIQREKVVPREEDGLFPRRGRRLRDPARINPQTGADGRGTYGWKKRRFLILDRETGLREATFPMPRSHPRSEGIRWR